jgi:hypothetical protein
MVFSASFADLSYTAFLRLNIGIPEISFLSHNLWFAWVRLLGQKICGDGCMTSETRPAAV